MSDDNRYYNNVAAMQAQAGLARSSAAMLQGATAGALARQFEPHIRTVADALTALQTRRDELTKMLESLEEQLHAAQHEAERVDAMLEAGVLKAQAESK